MSLILKYLENPEAERWEGWVWATCIFFAFLIRAFMIQHAYTKIFYNGVQLNNIVNLSMMQKILLLGTSSKKYFETGRIMNYLTVDTQMIYMTIMFSNFLFAAPWLIIIAMVLIIMEIGWVGILAPFILLAGTIF